MSFYKINYEVCGSHRIDYVTMEGNSIIDAVKNFTEWEQNTNGFKWHYNESAIVEIKKI